MGTLRRDNPPSSDAAILLKDAARIAGRSVTWIRDHRQFGPLVPTEINGRQAITAESLYALLREKRKRPSIYLAVDNTK
ncbi:hypothetical protein SAMN02983003_3871 [Devosia enhydra]|uniref:Uncharacterized protein n=1 Tax=Devosia enhydra TaxID=665118 RepID=A0A1K2I2S5_9HYPH|nr:hypothetical protein SAMN02983003_3871 [Devosia enhydra]